MEKLSLWGEIHVVNLDGDQELRRLRGRGKPRTNLSRPAQVDGKSICRLFLYKGRCCSELQNQSRVFRKENGEFSPGILVWIQLYLRDLSSQAGKHQILIIYIKLPWLEPATQPATQQSFLNYLQEDDSDIATWKVLRWDWQNHFVNLTLMPKWRYTGERKIAWYPHTNCH